KIKPDVLYINGLYSWHFNLVPLLFTRTPRKIISVRGMLHPGAMSQKRLKKKAYLRLWKIFNWQKKAIYHASDDIEAGYIRQHLKKVPLFTAFNFPRKQEEIVPVEKKEGKLKLLSIGIISPMKNYLSVLKVLKGAKERIIYSIYGPVKDNAYWQKCLLAMEDMPPNVTILYMGEVIPADVPSVLAEAEVFILPSKSENFGHALFEALGAGRPVITSHHTPWKDLKNHHAGINVEVNDAEIKQAISFFAAMDDQQFAAWSQGAAKFAAQAIQTEMLIAEYDQLFNRTISR
ncbi:MAG: glycosyltransferase, partial [Ferruginibacter sp.]